MRHLPVQKSIEMPAQISFFHDRGLVLQKPGPGGRGDAAGDWAIAGEIQMPLLAHFFFQFAGDLHGAAILMGDDRCKRVALMIHGQPGGGHDG